jgi:ABC-type branched-subunit amino acid transport system ATPase component
MKKLLKVTNLNVIIDDQPILKDIMFSLDYIQNMVIYTGVLMGSTTLLKTLSGLIEEATGSIVFEKQDILALPFQKRLDVTYNIPIVYEYKGLLHEHTIKENILLPMKKARSFDFSFYDMLVNDFDIKHLEDRYCDDLNDVQIQTVNIVRALCMKPKLILLDEIDGGMTKEDAIELLSRLLHYQKQFGYSMIVTTLLSPKDLVYDTFIPYSLFEEGFKKL